MIGYASAGASRYCYRLQCDLKGRGCTGMVNNDKQKLLCLLKILWTRTDRQNILSSQDLIRLLQDEYQCSCDRRTIYSNVDALIHAGFKIKQVKGNMHGYHFMNCLSCLKPHTCNWCSRPSSGILLHEENIK